MPSCFLFNLASQINITRMKKIFTLATLLVAFAANNALAQYGCAWAKKTSGTNEDWGTSVATDNFGNVYYLGNFYSQTINIGGTNLTNQPYTYFNYGGEMFLAKFDSCGNFKWAKKAGGNDETRAKAVATDAVGNVFVVGYGRSDTTTFGSVIMKNYALYDGFVAKYNSNGVTQWVKRIQGDYNDRAYAVSVDNGGNVFVSGSFQSTYVRCGNDSAANYDSNNNDNVFVLKLDNNGNEQWIRSGKGDYDAYGYGISTDAAGNCYTTGTYGGSYIRFANDSLPLIGYYDIFVVKHDANGNEQWLRTAGDSDNDEAFAIATDASGNSYITGFIGFLSSVNFGSHNITNTTSSYGLFVAKYDANGVAQWARKGQGNGYTENHGTSIALDNTSNPIVTGYYSSDSLQLGAVTLINRSITSGAMTGGDTAFDIFIAKYKSNGNLSWARNYGGDDHDFALGVATGAHNALYLTGEYKSPSIMFNGITLTATSTIGDAFIANNLSTNTVMPELCLATTDSSSNYNILYWDKTPYMSADSFLIFREVSTGIYSQIGIQSYNNLSQFTDTTRHVGPANGDPNVGTYRYKLQIKDTAGTYSVMGPYHNTIFFVNSSGSFTWNTYTVENMTVTPVTNFNLMRDDNALGVWHVIGTVAGTQTSLNDAQYATYQNTADWRVQALGFSCTPTLRYGNNSTEAAVVKSKSNISNNRGIGVAGVKNRTEIIVYPNPATNSFYLECNKELGSVNVLNTLGQSVIQFNSKNMAEQVDISKLPAGIYTLQVQGKFTKIIKE